MGWGSALNVNSLLPFQRVLVVEFIRLNKVKDEPLHIKYTAAIRCPLRINEKHAKFYNLNQEVSPFASPSMIHHTAFKLRLPILRSLMRRVSLGRRK